MYPIPWKTKGIVLTAPQPYKKEVRTVAEFIERILAPSGVNLIVLQTRYRYQFRRHPECMGYDPLSAEDVRLLLETSRAYTTSRATGFCMVWHRARLIFRTAFCARIPCLPNRPGMRNLSIPSISA